MEENFLKKFSFSINYIYKNVTLRTYIKIPSLVIRIVLRCIILFQVVHPELMTDKVANLNLRVNRYDLIQFNHVYNLIQSKYWWSHVIL